MLLEVCADSIDSALIAQSAGAYRIEYCNALSDGGITPSYAQIETARKLLHIKLYVLIRPRGGDFLYDDMEFEMMRAEIEFCGRIKCDGVVIGILNADGTVDTKRCKELIRIAHSYKMGVTFHRAFDRCSDFFQGLEDIVELGCERILTSGSRNSAVEGTHIIRSLVEQAGQRISIMPGAGIMPENAEALIQNTGVKELHGTFRSRYPSNMTYHNPFLSHPEKEYGIMRTDYFKVREMIDIIEKFNN
jgi:copper homeostasis protein